MVIGSSRGRLAAFFFRKLIVSTLIIIHRYYFAFGGLNIACI
jgi:hypothetical protein